MKPRAIFVFIFICSFIIIGNSPQIWAQSFYQDNSTAINFVNLGENQNLSHPFVNVVEQDSQGFIWIGTQSGLNRYDGKNLTLFSYSPNESNSISSSWIWDIQSDKEGRLWVASEGGIHLFLPEQNGFQNFTKENIPEIQGDKYRVIAEAPNGDIWFGSQDSGITILNPATFTFKTIRASTQIPEALRSDKIRDIHFDKNGNVWVATEGGALSFQKNSEQGFVHYAKATDISIPSDDIRTVFSDASGQIWVGTNDQGAFILNPEHGVNSDMFTHKQSVDQCASVVRDIHQDASGVIRLATDKGMCQWDANNQQFTLYTHDSANLASLISNNVNKIFQDAGGVVWVSTTEGLSRWNALIQPFRHISKTFESSKDLTSNVISAFATSSDQTLYVGTWGGGVNVIEPATGAISAIRQTEQSPLGLQDDRIMSLLVDANDTLWVGTFAGGLHRRLVDQDNFEVWQHDPNNENSLSANAISSLLMLKDGRLAAGTYGAGINLLSPNGDIERLTTKDLDSNHLASDQVTSLNEKAGFLWVGTHGGGVSRYELSSGNWQHINKANKQLADIGTDNVFSVLATDTDIWLATQDVGVVRLTPKSQDKSQYSVQFYNSSNGLSGNFAYAVLQDSSGYIWVSHSRGLSRINPKDGNIFNFNRNHGLQGLDFNAGSYHISQTGRLFFGGANGFNTFLPNQVPINNYQPPVKVTRFKLLNRNIPVYNAFRADGSIELNYNETFVDFEFASLDYTRPDQNYYRYKIDQLNDSWINLENNNHVALSSLNDGDYTLRILATNSDQIWGDQQLIIPLTVLPPVWRTNQAILIYLTILLAISFWVYRKRRAKILAQEKYRQHLEIEVQRRTNDLEKANGELATAIQSAESAREEAEQAAKAKANFLATMSHEIRTPMNSIIGMSEMLMHSPVSKKQSQYIESVKKAGETLLTLINDVLDYSKMEAGKVELEEHPFDIQDVIEDCAFLFASRAHEKGIELVTEFDVQCPNSILGDALRFRQVLQNLLSNAIKFTHFGVIAIKLTVKDDSLELSVTDSGIGISEESLAKIFNAFEQADNSTTRKFGGTGLGLSICQKLVNAMQGKISAQSKVNQGTRFIVTLPLRPAAVQNTKSEHQTTAMALPQIFVMIDFPAIKSMVTNALARIDTPYSEITKLEQLPLPNDLNHQPIVIIDERLLEDPNFKNENHLKDYVLLVLESVLPKEELTGDNIVRITKPIRLKLFSEALNQLAMGNINEFNQAKMNSKFENYEAHILLVEDVRANQEVAIAMLSLFNCKVEVANNGAEALALFSPGVYDLILMDCQMPVMDGFEATRQIRQQEAEFKTDKTPIIALTAGMTDVSRDSYPDAGMDSVLMKPFTAQQMKKLLAQFLVAKEQNTSRSKSSNLESIIDMATINGIKEIEKQTNKPIYKNVLGLYQQEFPIKLEQLKEAADKLDRGAVRNIAHAMKSLSANVGAKALQQVCASLEQDVAELSPTLVEQRVLLLESKYTESLPILLNYAGVN